MEEKIQCYNEKCKKYFKPKHKYHHYHSRKCFMKWYRREQKTRGYPVFACPHCNEKTKLDFNPIRDSAKWVSFCCPHCEKPPIG